MSRTWLIFGVLSAVGVGLMLITALALWRMLDFRARWHGLWVNSRWEQSLEQEGQFDDHTIVFFGDSQLALWRMAPSFGRLPIRNRGISGDQAVHAVQRLKRDSVEFIDFHEQLVDTTGWIKPQYTDDGLHPNESGYAEMTRLVLPHLTHVLWGSKTVGKE